MSDYRYERVLLKLSGEALMGDGGYGIDPSVTERLARQIKELHDDGVEVGIVVGGGNIFRGLQVMDSTATALCQDNHMPIIVLNIDGDDNIKKALTGEPVGTVVYQED